MFLWAAMCKTFHKSPNKSLPDDHYPEDNVAEGSDTSFFKDLEILTNIHTLKITHLLPNLSVHPVMKRRKRNI
jgi:hypothetical protein